MPYANNNGVRIHYEVEGSGPPLALLHGLGSDLESWSDAGYVEPLKKDYELVLVDVRGHGSSDKPHDPQAYKLKIVVADVLRILDDLDITTAHFMGYSMGGWIGLWAAKCALRRFRCLIVGGTDPYEDPSERKRTLAFYRKVYCMSEPARQEFVMSMFEKNLGPRLTPQLRSRLMANDFEALIALLSNDWTRGLEKTLPTINVPCLVFAGEADYTYLGAKKCADSLPDATFVSFPSLGHIETRYRSDLVLPHIIRFLGRVGKNRNTVHY